MNSTPAASSARRTDRSLAAVIEVSLSASSARRIVATPTADSRARSSARHELGLEHRLRALHDSVEGGHHPRNRRMPDPALHVADLPAGVALVPGAIELLGR